MITAELLRQLNPKLTAQQADTAAHALQQAAVRFDITTPLRLAHFLAQLGHESGFLPQGENLNYSASGLANTWPHRYSNGKRDARGRWLPNSLALQLHRKPQAIADHCYANRMGNGSPASGDGWRYRGRGLIQLTGRANYAETGARLGINLVQEPDLLLQPTYSAMAAGDFWTARGLNALADRDDVLGITRRINGGTNGLPHRQQLLAKAKRVLAQQREPQVLLVPMGGGDPVLWDGAAQYASQDLRELVPQLRQVYPSPGGPWEYGGVLRVWVRQSGDLVLERLPVDPTKDVPALPPKK
ncbi:glycoside hydrolase family 19 protein [Deinococcus radiophilus]|uniref:Glycoside hydrolase family 19 protein n=1 Tax=Deinococcus radiophilus TaxID=32062 RepID=A0A3S0JUC1_9DEIO|nr:glycoside hydrolase family 19 protein [Deinococcus radiophilus]RTR29081.1 glycoside hydrolase family 19 protein [Deinococcus radiophilus]UFA49667.1 glycoside hydrolase family 19 protein [Deinococcus radiophilus]